MLDYLTEIKDAFQFQSGTIKAAASSRLAISFSVFQFQSGTIKALWDSFKLTMEEWCQFQSGTIKASLCPMPNGHFFYLFQFQSGTIKAMDAQKKHGKTLLFQFQSGTIKAVNQMSERHRQACFNSNLVRLRRWSRHFVFPGSRVSIPIWYD